MQLVHVWGGAAKRLVTGPDDFYDRLSGQDAYGIPLGFAAISSLLLGLQFAVLSFLLNLSTPTQAVGGGLLLLVAFFVLSYVGYLVESLTAHLVLYLAGVRGLSRTMEAFAYPTAIRTTLALVPLVNLVAGAYGIYLQYLGVKSLHDVSSGKAVATVLLAIVLSWLPFVVVLVLFAAVIGSFVLGMGGAA